MSKSYSAALAALSHWFERQKRVLPWRSEPTLYRVWVSEIMLQQTQVATVTPYFERFLARFPTVESLAAATEAEVLRLWAGLGYYSRARNLHRAAQEIVARGGFPTTREGWLELTGVGNYTAGAILSIALDLPEAILDGNVERVLARFRRVSRQNGDAAYKAVLWELSADAVQAGVRQGIRPSVLNQALMELGAMVCVPRQPRCEACPLATACEAHARGEEAAYPPKKKPKEWIAVQEELHCLVDPAESRILLRQRSVGEWRAGLWDLLEAPPAEISGPRAVWLGSLETRHVVTRHRVTRVTHVWKCARNWRVAEVSPVGLRWVSATSPEVAVGSALKRTLARIRDTFPEALP